jgi:hypothetical protein
LADRGKKLAKAIDEFLTYLQANEPFIPNYGERWRNNEIISLMLRSILVTGHRTYTIPTIKPLTPTGFAPLASLSPQGEGLFSLLPAGEGPGMRASVTLWFCKPSP